MTQPNFFILGAPKCGTTSLAAWLSEHPEAFITNPKEPCYFDPDYKNLTSIRTLADYQRLYRKAHGHKAIGEASSFYLRSECAVAKILEYAPEAKFIVCLRNPIHMARSMHAHWFRIAHESIEDFAKAWEAIEDRRAGRGVPASCPNAKMLDYAYNCSLGAQAQRLLEQVPRERVHFVWLEDWQDPRPTWLSVLGFLGLEDDGRSQFPVHNEAKRVRWPWMARGLAIAAKLRHRIGIKHGFGVMTGFARFNEVSTDSRGHSAPLSDAFAARLREAFASDIHLLSKLTGRNLQHWL